MIGVANVGIEFVVFFFDEFFEEVDGISSIPRASAKLAPALLKPSSSSLLLLFVSSSSSSSSLFSIFFFFVFTLLGDDFFDDFSGFSSSFLIGLIISSLIFSLCLLLWLLLLDLWWLLLLLPFDSSFILLELLLLLLWWLLCDLCSFSFCFSFFFSSSLRSRLSRSLSTRLDDVVVADFSLSDNFSFFISKLISISSSELWRRFLWWWLLLLLLLLCELEWLECFRWSFSRSLSPLDSPCFRWWVDELLLRSDSLCLELSLRWWSLLWFSLSRSRLWCLRDSLWFDVECFFSDSIFIGCGCCGGGGGCCCCCGCGGECISLSDELFLSGRVI